MLYKNEIGFKIILTFLALILGILSTIVGIGLMIESDLKETLTVKKEHLKQPVSQQYSTRTIQIRSSPIRNSQ